jgi:hypothetical protein
MSARTFADRLVLVAWLMGVTSLFLPASVALAQGGTPPGTPLSGWEAISSANYILFLSPWIVIVEPRFAVLPLIGAVTFLLLAIPLLYSAADCEAWLLVPLLCFSASLWLLPDYTLNAMRVGAYVWQAAFVVAGIACVMRSFADEAREF